MNGLPGSWVIVKKNTLQLYFYSLFTENVNLKLIFCV